MLSRVRIVLVEPSHPGNIGATARAMKTMGHSRLYLVKPTGFPGAEASARAAGAGDVLAAAVVCESLQEALAECRLVYGTSARRRSLAWPEYDPATAAHRVTKVAGEGDIAVVFGRERSGLSNKELDLCQAMIRVPTAPGFSSLNLAAAVQLVCYEFYRAHGMDSTPAPAPATAYPSTQELEGFYAHLEECATRIGFLDPARPRRLRRRMRLLLSRAYPDLDELNMLRGFLTAAIQAAEQAANSLSSTAGVARAGGTAYHERMAAANKGATYRGSGVDIDAGERLVERIRGLAATTRINGVMEELGGFAAGFDLAARACRDPVLVAATDGVGTKLRLLAGRGQHRTAGIDLVAMCANDVLCRGAQPLFFLDYMAFGRLDERAAHAVADGIADGCRQAGMALIGGETAEMPGFYREGEYDLAGFCVGLAERDELLDGSGIEVGDALIALASSGAHANGYSLIRQILEQAPACPAELMAALLAPTRIYVSALAALRRACTVRGVAHITGGGLPGNVARILPENLAAVIDPRSWQWPRLFAWLQQQGGVTATEMLRTFNCGVGLVLCVPRSELDEALQCLADAGEQAWRIGHITSREQDAAAVRIGA